MSDKQPEALRLAELMMEKPDSDGHCMKAAAELRRLHALCEEMGEGLEALEESRAPTACYYAKGSPVDKAWKRAFKARAKWKESK